MTTQAATWLDRYFGTGTTALAAPFVQPAVNANVSVAVVDTASFSAAENIFIAVGGYYQIVSITNETTMLVKNLGAAGVNAAPAATIPLAALVSPAGPTAGAPVSPSVIFQYMTAPFTAPPSAASWPLLGASSGGDASADFPGGGVLFNAPAGGNIAVPTKALAVPGGAHVITMFTATRIMPTDNVDPRSYIAFVAAGVDHFAEAMLQYVGDGLGVYAAGHKRSNTAYTAGSTNLNGGVWSIYKGGHPFAASWWRMTVDDGSYGLERYQIGGGFAPFTGTSDGANGTWETVFSAAHGCGPIQRVGFTVRSNLLTPVSAILLSYVET